MRVRGVHGRGFKIHLASTATSLGETMNNPPRAQYQATRRQHYVWRHYLEAWQFKPDHTNCLRDQRIFTTNLTNIMVERDFYKLSWLTQLDVAFLELFLEKIPSEELRTLNRSLVRQLGLMPRLNELIQRGDEFSDAEKQAAPSCSDRNRRVAT